MTGPITAEGRKRAPLHESRLPFWKTATYSFDDGTDEVTLLALTCPRPDCGEGHYVDSERPLKSPTSPCPYCFRVARYPELEVARLFTEEP